MSNTNFDHLYESLKTGIETLAKDNFKNYYTEANADGKSALTNLKSSLQQWIIEMGNGEISADDLSFLLQGEEALSEMIALKQAGLASVHLDEFKNSLVNMIVSTSIGFVKV